MVDVDGMMALFGGDLSFGRHDFCRFADAQDL